MLQVPFPSVEDPFLLVESFFLDFSGQKLASWPSVMVVASTSHKAPFYQKWAV
jgi:hypothetical protein